MTFAPFCAVLAGLLILGSYAGFFWSVLRGAKDARIPPAPAFDRDAYIYDAPVFRPGLWAGSVRAASNCYAYALNARLAEHADRLPAPGRNRSWALEILATLLTAKSILRAAARADGLIPCDGHAAVPPGHYLAALFYRPGFLSGDFHWYRLDRHPAGGFAWTHKTGRGAASDHDMVGAAIRDLPAARLDPRFPVWGGYFLVPRGGIGLARRKVTAGAAAAPPVPA